MIYLAGKPCPVGGELHPEAIHLQVFLEVGISRIRTRGGNE
jgi:hypothetical protein